MKKAIVTTIIMVLIMVTSVMAARQISGMVYDKDTTTVPAKAYFFKVGIYEKRSGGVLHQIGEERINRNGTWSWEDNYGDATEDYLYVKINDYLSSFVDSIHVPDENSVSSGHILHVAKAKISGHLYKLGTTVPPQDARWANIKCYERKEDGSLELLKWPRADEQGAWSWEVYAKEGVNYLLEAGGYICTPLDSVQFTYDNPNLSGKTIYVNGKTRIAGKVCIQGTNIPVERAKVYLWRDSIDFLGSEVIDQCEADSNGIFVLEGMDNTSTSGRKYYIAVDGRFAREGSYMSGDHINAIVVEGASDGHVLYLKPVTDTISVTVHLDKPITTDIRATTAWIKTAQDGDVSWVHIPPENLVIGDSTFSFNAEIASNVAFEVGVLLYDTGINESIIKKDLMLNPHQSNYSVDLFAQGTVRNLASSDALNQSVGGLRVFAASHLQNGPSNIVFSVQQSGHTMVKLFRIDGKLIKTIVNEPLMQGIHRVFWNGQDFNGKDVVCGSYIAKLSVGNQVTATRLYLVK